MQPDRSRRPALAVATLAAFLTPFMGSATNIALPAIAADLELGALSLSWVASSFLLAAAMVLVPCGRAADIHGRRRLFVLGVATYLLSSLLAAVAVSGGMLIASRALQGVGGAMIFGTGMAILTSVFPAAERGRVLGINVAAVYVGLSVGPFLGGC